MEIYDIFQNHCIFILKLFTSYISFITYVTETDNFQRFVIQKLVAFELKLNAIERHQKLFAEKLPITNHEEKDDIDVLQDLPLQNENDLQVLETKLKNNEVYRNQLVSLLLLSNSIRYLITVKLYCTIPKK